MDTLTLYSKVPKAKIEKSLLQGSFFAGVGGAILTITGAFLPLQNLQISGLLLFSIAIALITFGLLPYRRLCKLRDHPHTIQVHNRTKNTAAKIVWIDQKKRERLTIPFSAIKNISHLSEGIGLLFFSPPPEPIILHYPPLDIEKLQKHTQKALHVDLLLPFFDSEAYQELVDCWMAEQHC